MESTNTPNQQIAIVGSGPAGLMAASALAEKGFAVTIFEKHSALGRKILIAGSSGLNISHDCPLPEFVAQYRGDKRISTHFKHALTAFGPNQWLQFINSLGVKTICGSSHRYFTQDRNGDMKGAEFLRLWLRSLERKKVTFETNNELLDFETSSTGVRAHSTKGSQDFSALLLALGGGSYTAPESPLRWVELLKRKGLKFKDFAPSNVGYEIDWPQAFFKEAEGQPLKSIALHSSRGMRFGDLMVTRYGLEGTPIYQLGTVGWAHIDLKTNLSEAEIISRLKACKENLSPVRRIKKQLQLCPSALALVFHCTPAKGSPEALPAAFQSEADFAKVARLIKRFPVELARPRPLEEAISSSGGLSFEELDDSLMLRKFPGVYAAGEMLDWDAPTGGFLIQGCVAQGRLAAVAIAKQLGR